MKVINLDEILTSETIFLLRKATIPKFLRWVLWTHIRIDDKMKLFESKIYPVHLAQITSNIRIANLSESIFSKYCSGAISKPHRFNRPRRS